VPSGVPATPKGLVPTRTVATTDGGVVAVSITETLLEVVFATKAKGTAAEGLTNKPIAS
jgi:hypothetical protein